MNIITFCIDLAADIRIVEGDSLREYIQSYQHNFISKL